MPNERGSSQPSKSAQQNPWINLFDVGLSLLELSRGNVPAVSHGVWNLMAVPQKFVKFNAVPYHGGAQPCAILFLYREIVCRDFLVPYPTYRRSPVTCRIYTVCSVSYEYRSSDLCPAWEPASLVNGCAGMSASMKAISIR